jgi:CRP-like cAMP-binding protein
VSTRSGQVNLLEEDPDLGRCIDPARAEEAARRGVVRAVSVQSGEWAPAEDAMEPGGLGLLVLDGVLLRRVTMAERHSLDPVGAGDLIRPFERRGDRYAMVPAEVGWQALTPARLAVLDVQFTRRICAFPEVIDELVGRLARRSAAQAVRLAILQQPRLSARLHFVLWHLADRFGRVTREGVVLPLQLSHELLAQLVGAQRPPVSRALKGLERAGLVDRRADGSWLLGRCAPEGLGELAGPTSP